MARPFARMASAGSERTAPVGLEDSGPSLQTLLSGTRRFSAKERQGRPIQLRTGRSVRVRSATPADASRLARLHQSLSPESRYLRYFSPHDRLSDLELHHFTHPDGHDHLSLLVLDGERPVGHALLDRIERTDEAELALTIVDDWQGQGLGTQLCHELARAARASGLRRLVAFVLPQNRMMRDVMRDLDLGKISRFEDGVVSYHVDLEDLDSSSDVLRIGRIAVTALLGGSLALIGGALLFLPGPGWAFIVAGLSVLAAEFSWSRRWLRRLEQGARRGFDWVRTEASDPDAWREKES